MTIFQILLVMFISLSGIVISYSIIKQVEFKTIIRMNALINIVEEREKHITEFYDLVNQLLTEMEKQGIIIKEGGRNIRLPLKKKKNIKSVKK